MGLSSVTYLRNPGFVCKFIGSMTNDIWGMASIARFRHENDRWHDTHVLEKTLAGSQNLQNRRLKLWPKPCWIRIPFRGIWWNSTSHQGCSEDLHPRVGMLDVFIATIKRNSINLIYPIINFHRPEQCGFTVFFTISIHIPPNYLIIVIMRLLMTIMIYYDIL